jgi:hypothetical protein
MGGVLKPVAKGIFSGKPDKIGGNFDYFVFWQRLIPMIVSN